MSNRPFLVILIFMVMAIGLAWFASTLHPGGDLPIGEKEALEDQKKAEEEQKEREVRQMKLDRSPESFDKVKEGAVRVTMEIEKRGTLVMELYPQAAPLTVAHITDLIKQKFYDGIKIHRIEATKDLGVIQMGDPYSKGVEKEQFQAAQIGTHGSGKMIPLEVRLPHRKYTVALARSPELDSGDSQFYINTEDNSRLDGEYCVFGRIIQGSEILPSLKLGDRIKRMALN